MSPQPQLYVWPSKWDLPSMDVQSLVAILHLQLTIPGRFTIVESVDPDQSPSGQLPFLVHGHHSVAPVSSIVKYVKGFDEERKPQPVEGGQDLPIEPSLDPTDPQTKAKSVAWVAYVDRNLGDLILHSLYVMNPNYLTLTLPTLTSFLHAPQAYYVPGRLRDTYKPRLEVAGLWDLMDEAEGTENATTTPSSWTSAASKRLGTNTEEGAEKIKWTFSREKILDRARATFDVLAGLIPEGSFIYGNQPTTLDVHLAAHILLILHAPLPNPLLKTLLLESYPTLIDHAILLRILAFPSSPLPSEAPLPASPTIKRASASIEGGRPYPPVYKHERPTVAQAVTLATFGARHTISGLGASLRSFWARPQSDNEDTQDLTPLEKEQLEAEKELARWRWVWYTAAGLGVMTYAVWYGMLQVAIVKRGEVDEEEDE